MIHCFVSTLQCVILNNTCESSLGGAITAGSNDDTTAIVNITGCTISNNQAPINSGGALLLLGAVYIQNTVFSNNTAYRSGGAIDAELASLTVTGTVFDSNTAIANGGAIFIDTKPLIVSNTVFTANSAGGNGGAVRLFGSANFSNSTFTENVSFQYGGAISAQTGSSLVIANSLLSGNNATFAGGAIFTFAPQNEFVIAETVHFSNNTASCCYAQNGGINTNAPCTSVDGNSGTGTNECCLAKYYSDGEHCQLCTKELTCDNIIGATTSTVVLPKKLWRASTPSLKTYSCWNADACVGGAAIRNTDDYCAAGYKGPCKLLINYTTLTTVIAKDTSLMPVRTMFAH
jgi:predicted outer membrane repeat protein